MSKVRLSLDVSPEMNAQIEGVDVYPRLHQVRRLA